MLLFFRPLLSEVKRTRFIQRQRDIYSRLLRYFCLCVCVFVCEFVCVCERERETEMNWGVRQKKGGRERERERERLYINMMVVENLIVYQVSMDSPHNSLAHSPLLTPIASSYP